MRIHGEEISGIGSRGNGLGGESVSEEISHLCSETPHRASPVSHQISAIPACPANAREDIAARLRAKAARGGIIPIGDMTLLAAAEEIERLRKALANTTTIPHHGKIT